LLYYFNKEGKLRKEILKKDIPKLINRLSKKYPLFGPVKKGEDFVFERIKNPAKIKLDYSTTILPPTKFFMPLREKLFRYQGNDFEIPETKLEQKVIIFGIHLVDIHAIIRLDKIMAEAPKDFYYWRRRNKTILIGISGSYIEDDFHRALGVDIHKGYDLFLEDAGDRYLAKSKTKKGNEILKSKFFRPSKIKETKLPRQKNPILTNLLKLTLAVEKSVGTPVWKKESDSCFGCGICSFVCPLCFCFDISDSLVLDGCSGCRWRERTACHYKDFSRIAGAGTLEKTHVERFYHWYYHKFVQMPREFGFVGCVNCGRCTKYCPANIKFREVLERVEEKTTL